MPTPKSFRWGLALGLKEAVYGVQIADAGIVDSVAIMAADFAKLDIGFRDNADEINGYMGPTEYEIESKEGSLQRKFQLSVEVLAAMLALQWANVVTTGASDPFTHTIRQRDKCVVNPPSTSVIEGLDCAGFTATYLLYKGLVVESQSIEIKGKGPIDHTVNFKHDGSETAKAAYVFPAFTTVKKLLGNNATFKLGTAGTENLTSILRDLKIDTNSAINQPPNINSGALVTEYQWGGMNPDLKISGTIRGDKSHALYTAYKAGTAVIFDLLIDPGVTPLRTVNFHCSQCRIDSCEIVPQGNETQLKFALTPINNATDAGPGVWILKNGKATYLVASP